jgi:hypothetical protein
VNDPYGRALAAAHGDELGAEPLRERLDTAGAETGFFLSKHAIRSGLPKLHPRRDENCAQLLTIADMHEPADNLQ